MKNPRPFSLWVGKSEDFKDGKSFDILGISRMWRTTLEYNSQKIENEQVHLTKK